MSAYVKERLQCHLRIDVNARHGVWFRRLTMRAKLQELIGEGWRDGCFVEKIQFPPIMAVQYGILAPGQVI